MLILHANWWNGSLHLWAESQRAFAERRESTEGTAANGATAVAEAPAAAVINHPFAAEPDELRHALSTVLGGEIAGLTTAELILRLPVHDQRPDPSDRLAGPRDEEDGVAADLGSFRVATITVEPDASLELLLQLEELDPHGVELVPGHSVAYWSATGRFVLELLTDQRFIPTLLQPKNGGLRAEWRPWLHDEDARNRVGRLIEMMPPVVRAVGSDSTARPWPILDEALTTLCDATIRRILHDDDYGDAIDGRDPEEDSQVAWLGGLLGAEPKIETLADAATEMLRDVSTWIGGLDEGGDDQNWRLVLKLCEPVQPDDEETSDSLIPRASTKWRLSFHLRQIGEGNDVVDAEQVWADPASIAVAGSGERNPEELLLAELARAGRLCPAIESGLNDAHPCGTDLDIPQAYAFLTEHRELLEEAGIDVVTPSWWGQPAAQLSARLHVDTPDFDAGGGSGATASGSSLLGLNSLVQYRWKVAVGDRVLSMDEFNELAARAASGASLLQIDGQWIEVRPEQVKAAQETIEARPGGEMTLLEAIQVAHGAIGASMGLPVQGMDATGWVADLLGASSDETMMPMLTQPKEFKGELRPYQLAGLSWLAWLDRFGLGACLADDMGLGKTIQLIALLLAERENGSELGPTLLVVPTSVIGNWKREIERFSSNITVHIQHGPERPIGEEFHELVAKFDVVITTYTLVSRDRETMLGMDWHRVVLDEAQYIKNPPTKQTATIRALRTHRRVALTGTPVENRLSELWSIMEFCNPGYLGQAGEFRRRFSVPIERHRDQGSAERLRRLVRPFILRRLKTDPTVIDDLPDCVTTKEYATLTTSQAEAYEQAVNEMLGQVGGADGIRRRGLVLATLVKLKQICNHPVLIDKSQSLTDLDAATCRKLAAKSGKCQRILGMLEEVQATGDSALIFTQFRRMGHLLSAIVRHELDTEVLFLHGGSTPARRQQMIDRFQEKDGKTPFFILSLKAGGVGLNLTAANHVFHFDRWWNPAVENQATDRAFRIGQTQTVHVHKFICMGTLEERVDQMIEKKTELAQNIIGAGEDWLTEMDTGQLRNLLTLRDSAMETES